MNELKHLFERNQKWSDKIKESNPDFFNNLSKQQTPEYLWIGCSDSRVPANVIVDLPPGEIFVHRNIANQVIHTDINCMSVIHYAVDVLKVKHIIVCGHYGCGGVLAAMEEKSLGPIDDWLINLKEIYLKHKNKIDAEPDIHKKGRLLSELNVVEQVSNVSKTETIKNAWKAGRELHIHGLVYDVEMGILKDLNINMTDSA